MLSPVASLNTYRFFGVAMTVACNDPVMNELVEANFRAFQRTSRTPSQLLYRIESDTNGLSLLRADNRAALGWSGLTHGECLYLLEKDLTLELQKLRSDLYFLHAAALSHRGHNLLLVGRSGGGKSTTCWGLLRHGCQYLSDELAPVDLETLQVQPYPRALCLKTEPPAGFPLPTATRRTEATLHIPIDAMPLAPVSTAQAVHDLIFVEHRHVDHPPQLEPLSRAQAGAQLYGQALNPLSHPADGLDAALRIAAACRCWQLTTGELSRSIELVLNTLARSD